MRSNGAKVIEGQLEIERNEGNSIEPKARAIDCHLTDTAAQNPGLPGKEEQSPSIDFCSLKQSALYARRASKYFR